MLATIVLAVAVSSSMQVRAPIGLERAEVESVLRAALPELERCNGEGAAGTAVFDVSVNDAGVVSEIRDAFLSSSPTFDDVATCVSARLAALRFPTPRGQVDVSLRATVHVSVHEMRVHATAIIASQRRPTVVLDRQGVPATIVDAVALQNAALVDCYRHALEQTPQADGALTVQHIVDEHGLVDDALLPQSPRSTVAHVPLFAACVRGALRQLRYPEQTPTTVSLHLVFQRPPTFTDIAATTATLPLRRCIGRDGRRVAVAFNVDDKGQATNVAIPQDITDEVDTSCVRSVVEAAHWRPGAARIAATLVDERLGPDTRGLFAAQLEHVVDCYGIGSSYDSTLEGGIMLHFVIDADGFVASVDTLPPTVRGVVELTEPTTIACIVDVVRKTRFPPGGGLQTVTHQVVFKR
jgi:hypothetical protein